MMNPTFILGPNKPRAKHFPWLVWMLELEVKFADNLWDHFTHFQQTDILSYACAGTGTGLSRQQVSLYSPRTRKRKQGNTYRERHRLLKNF